MDNYIHVRGAREHNLKNINLSIPKNKLIVFTGLSGSGKSSMAFDTLYAEGQRRYVESLSAYARQFLGIMDKPDVDSIDGLSPAISIDQKSTSHNPRSTIGTITEIYDYLRLLFARIGKPHCPNCNNLIEHLTKEQIKNNIVSKIKTDLKIQKQCRYLILSPIIKDKKGEFDSLFKSLRQKGFSRVRIDHRIIDLDDEIVLIKTNKHTIEAVVDRLTFTKTTDIDESRLLSDLETALNLSEGEMIFSNVYDSDFNFPKDPKKMTDCLYSEKYACPKCNISLTQPEPRSFSFNSPHGACPTCTGIGTLLKINKNLIFSHILTIDEGGILPFAKLFENDTWYAKIIRGVCRDNNIPTKKALSEITQKEKDLLLYGTGERTYRVKGLNRQGYLTEIEEKYEGIISDLEKRYKETDSDYVRSEVEKYMSKELCPICLGTRLKKEALSYTLDDLNIVEVASQSISQAKIWIHHLASKLLNERDRSIAAPIIKELIFRIGFLDDVGLGYLTLDRSAMSLSGGESQRIRLASQIGTGLSGILYVLDEPSIGLHQKDNKKLIKTLINLRDLGNSVVVVEHDRETIMNADYVFDFGPGAGEKGGYIVSEGSPNIIINDKNSVTGPYLSYKRKINFLSENGQNRKEYNKDKSIFLSGANEHNLKNIDVEFPLGKFICITGVSGSGKSTLINDILYHAIASEIYPLHREKPGKFSHITGIENIEKIVMVDQSPIGRTPRSNPATYTGCFSYIRDIFARTKDARTRGYNVGKFSFNVKGGRCESCEGEGQIKIEMQFLPDVYVKCESCSGSRYTQEILKINYRGKNISDVLNMTVGDALAFFSDIHPIRNKLETLHDVGLSYIKLGQPATQLSGGEAQRIKLASELSKKGRGNALYLLDEPTTGLHFADMEKLIYVLKQLVEIGNTVIVIEHNLDLIKNADWIIDLGPEGGDAGGKIIAKGTVSDLIKCPNSYTGIYLKEII